ncbi:MAG: glycosyltransferase family 39 protein [Thaumarchaeota archaeon]|jgi:4-amino-4-deoxy-L-arabinose transferase-like glycosyltransferase|nr:glycosyltransferase family 39 protein [Candidatus Geocrenenecus arthurdayi]
MKSNIFLNDKHIILGFIITSILLSVTLFFNVEKYAESDLILSAKSVKNNDFQTMLFTVRPILLILAYIVPQDPLQSLPIISLISYLASVYLSYKFTKELYNEESALLASYLLTTNFAVILVSSAPMADCPSIASNLTILYLYYSKLRDVTESREKWLIYGLLTSLLILVRENVLTSVIAICIILFYRKIYRQLGIYLFSIFTVLIIWQLFTTIQFNMNYLTQLSTGLSLSMKYSGVFYNPIKVVRYLIVGLTPVLIILALVGILLDENEERFKIVHFIALPPLLLSILWPAIYEPRVAIIALPGIIHLCGYGLNKLITQLSKKPFYRIGGGSLLLIILLTLNLLGNLFLAYINNGSKISPIWRFL